MQIVDGIAPMVLNVPAEGGEAHAHIKPWELHPTDVRCDMSQHRCIQNWHVVEVPATAQIILDKKKCDFMNLHL